MSDKQLTPEEHAYKLFPMQDGNVEDDINAYKRLIFLDGVNYAAQQTAAKDGRIKELEVLYSISLQTSGLLRDQRNEALDKNEQKDARIAELEKECKATANACERWSNRWAEKNVQHTELLEKVERLEKGMDQAISSLKIWQHQHPYIKPRYSKPNEYQRVLIERDKLIGLLSSRENKKP